MSVNVCKLHMNLLVSTKPTEEIGKPSVRITHHVEQGKFYRNKDRQAKERKKKGRKNLVK